MRYAKLSEDDEMKDLMDDDEIRNYFNSRDPNRKKVDPIIDLESAEQHKGKASALTPKEETEEIHGVSFSQHIKQIRETARHYIWIGMALAFTIAIIVTLIK